MIHLVGTTMDFTRKHNVPLHESPSLDLLPAIVVENVVLFFVVMAWLGCIS